MVEHCLRVILGTGLALHVGTAYSRTPATPQAPLSSAGLSHGTLADCKARRKARYILNYDRFPGLGRGVDDRVRSVRIAGSGCGLEPSEYRRQIDRVR